jgi:hypothetical protein
MRKTILSFLFVFASTACLAPLTAAQLDPPKPPDRKVLDFNDIIKHQREWRSKILPLRIAATEAAPTPQERAAYVKATQDFAASAQKMYPEGTIVRVTGYVKNVTEYEKNPVSGKPSFNLELSSSTKARRDPEDNSFFCYTSDDALVSKLVRGQQVTLEGRFRSIQSPEVSVENNKKGFSFQIAQCTESKGQ